TLEQWGLDYESLSSVNAGLVMVRISGYGQTGPYRHRPGFGVIGEAMGGLRYVTGTPDRPPSRVGVSIGDTLSALYGVIGAMFAPATHRWRRTTVVRSASNGSMAKSRHGHAPVRRTKCWRRWTKPMCRRRRSIRFAISWPTRTMPRAQ